MVYIVSYLEYIQKMNPSLKIPEEKKEEKTRDDWSRAFYQYVMEEGQQLNVLSDTDNPVMALWDMDGDKIPELIIGTNDTYGSYSSAKVVKYSNQGMKVLEGNLDSYGTIFGANHTADPDYPGVYFHYWRRGDYVDAAGGQDMEGAMHYYIIYSYIDGEALKDIEVASYTENDLYYYRDNRGSGTVRCYHGKPFPRHTICYAGRNSGNGLGKFCGFKQH